MFAHDKLPSTVREAKCNRGLANRMPEQFGGPQGERAAATRDFTHSLAEADPGRKDMLIDIAAEELSTQGDRHDHRDADAARARIAEGVDTEAEMYEQMAGNDSPVTQVVYGGAAALINSAGVPWTATCGDSIGDPTCDLRSSNAAESQVKIGYECPIDPADDPGVQEALGFLTTRRIAHQRPFEGRRIRSSRIARRANSEACRYSPTSTRQVDR